MAKVTKDDILEFLENATILEINDVVKAIEEKFGVSAAAPVAVAAGAVADDAGAAAESSEVSVYLKEVGQAKIQVIKAVKEVLNVGLVDAKKIVDGVGDQPSLVKEKIKSDEADEIKKKLEEAGAVVEVK